MKKTKEIKSLKVDRSKLITPKAYSDMMNISPSAVTKMMNEGRVTVINVTGGRLILLP